MNQYVTIMLYSRTEWKINGEDDDVDEVSAGVAAAPALAADGAVPSRITRSSKPSRCRDE